MQSANGVDWYAMQQQAEAPAFEQGDAASAYNQAVFRDFMPGYEQQVAQVDSSHREEGHFEVRHADGSGTAFYDTARYSAPRGDYQVYEDNRGQQWIAVHGDPAVERRPVYEDGKPVYDGENVRTVSVESVRYKSTPSRFGEPEQRKDNVLCDILKSITIENLLAQNIEEWYLAPCLLNCSNKTGEQS